MKNVIDLLNERNYIEQITHPQELKEYLENNKVSFYIGIDPTADSLHVGHFVSLMVASHLQKAGHRPIILVGGGTATIGDPSGKTDMRKMLSREEIDHNVECIKEQVAKFVSFEGENAAIIVNNADWLLDLKFVEFVREIGSLFSVNKMLAAECYKQRLETGLTFKLLTTKEGKKMGKTEKGALWLSAEKTSPYEFYQYWRNVEDESVENVFNMLTFLSPDKIKELCNVEGEKINEAKKILAFEITKLIHGEEEAKKAEEASNALFSGSGNLDNMPSTKIENTNISILDALLLAGLVPSKGQARTLINQSGISLNDEKVTDVYFMLSDDDFKDGYAILKKGKKVFHKLEK